MTGLLKNELIKAVSRKGYRTLLVLLAIAFLLIPTVISLVGVSIFSEEEKSPADWAEEMYLMADYYASSDPIYSDYWTAKGEAADFFAELGENWKYSYFNRQNLNLLFPERSEEYYGTGIEDLFSAVRAWEIIEGGAISDLELYDSPIGYTVYETYFVTEKYNYSAEDGLWYGTEGEALNGNPYTPDEIRAARESAENDLAEACARVKTFTVADILDRCSETVDAKREQALGTVSSKNPDEAAEELSRRLEICDMADRMIEHLRGELTTLDGEWRVDFLNNFISAGEIHSDYYSVPMSESKFLSLYNSDADYTYEKYVKEAEKKRAAAEGGLAMAEYAVINNIPPEKCESYSKYLLYLSIDTCASVARIFMIVLAAGILTSEFSSGTIKLLLVRPKKRWKILASKMLALLTIHVLLVIAGTLCSTLICTVFGAGDIFTPDLAYRGGSVKEIPAIFGYLAESALLAVQSLPILALTFAMGVWMERSALPTVLGIILNTVSGALRIAAITIGENSNLIKLTVLPYLELTDMRKSAANGTLEQIAQGYSEDVLELLGIDTSGYSLALALAVIAVHLALIVALAIRSFNKKDIKR